VQRAALLHAAVREGLMACCALAAFIVSQLLVALDFLRERVLGLSPAGVPLNGNAAWRLGDAAPALPPRAVFASPRRVALALGGGALAFGFAFAAFEAGERHRPHPLQIPYLCSSSAGIALD
jgi:hypothetical protein